MGPGIAPSRLLVRVRSLPKLYVRNIYIYICIYTGICIVYTYMCVYIYIHMYIQAQGSNVLPLSPQGLRLGCPGIFRAFSRGSMASEQKDVAQEVNDDEAPCTRAHINLRLSGLCRYIFCTLTVVVSCHMLSMPMLYCIAYFVVCTTML